MEFLKKRSTARIALIAVIVVFTVIGVNMSAARVVRHTEKQFYDGVYLRAEKYTEAAIDGHLQKRAQAALGLLSLMPEGNEAAELRKAREALLSARSIGEKYEANVLLERAYIEAADKLPESVREGESAKSYLSALSGAQSAIERSAYNAAAQAANESILSGALRPLRAVLFTRGAELFA